MLEVRIVHDTGELARVFMPSAPRVGETISFSGQRHDCRKVTRVDWQVYIARSGKETAAQTESVIVFVE